MFTRVGRLPGFSSRVMQFVTVDKDNGRRITFTGVSTLEVGSVKYDGDKEATKDIKMIAGKRIEE